MIKIQVYCWVEAAQNDASLKKTMRLQAVPRIGEEVDGHEVTRVRHSRKGVIIITSTAPSFEGPDDGAPVIRRLKKLGYRICSNDECLDAEFG